jgi:hypothetical protein
MALTKVFNRMIGGSSANVLDFGAIGDGVTDDAAAIQAAFNSGAKEVILPTGTFLFGTTSDDFISLTSAHNGVTFRGAGGVLKMSANTPVLSSKSAVDIVGAQDILVTGIRYDGNAANNTGNTMSSTGLVGFSSVRLSDGVIFSENFIENSNNNGVYFTDGTKRGLCVNNIFKNCFGTEMRVGLPNGSNVAEGVFVGNTVILDTNIHAGVPKQDGMFGVRWGGDAIFTGNKIVVASGVTDTPASLIWIAECRRVIISGNEVVNESAGAYCIQGNLSNSPEQMIVRGNTFIGGQGILFSDDGTARTLGELIIADNILKAQSQDGIVVDETGAGLFTVSDMTVTGNVIEYSNGYAIKSAQDGVSISNNKITRLGGSHGIFISGANNICSGNAIDVAASTSRGIEIYASDSVFTGNRVYNYTGTPIREQGSANWNLIHGNHTKGGTITTIGANTVLADNI